MTDNTVTQKGETDKHWSTKYYTETNDTNPTKKQGITRVLRKDKQVLIYKWHQSCYSCRKSDDKWLRQTKYFCGRLWLIFRNGEPCQDGDYSIFGRGDFHLTTRDHWFSSFIVSSNIEGNSDWNSKLYDTKWERYTPLVYSNLSPDLLQV
jgi:hypothetical protein